MAFKINLFWPIEYKTTKEKDKFVEETNVGQKGLNLDFFDCANICVKFVEFINEFVMHM